MVAKITRLKSKSTINDLIDKFVKNRILDEITGKKKNRRFVYRQYLNKFSRDKVV